MKKVISILTTTRADYGLLKPVIKKLLKLEIFTVKLVVTGAHLSGSFGNTYLEIENDQIIIDEKIEIMEKDDSQVAISKTMSNAIYKFSDYFERTKPDLLVLLGDRYETFAIASTAFVQKIPIVHIHGGEVTIGAIDDSLRHAIAKFSYLHFTSTEDYRKRVIQLGEQPSRVFNIGALGVENAKNEELYSKEELEEQLGIKFDKPYILVTYHPVSLQSESNLEQIKVLLEVCNKYPQYNFIFSKSNADFEGKIINEYIEFCSAKTPNIFLYSSLGNKKYLSALKYCSMIIGNSSSGIIEAPSFGIPTINIGDRQAGRIQSNSIINCKAKEKDIIHAMNLAMSLEFREICKNSINPYEKIGTSDKIVFEITELLNSDDINLRKKFYDL